MEEGTFKERYLAGEIPFEEIDRYISRWNNSDDPAPCPVPGPERGGRGCVD